MMGLRYRNSLATSARAGHAGQGLDGHRSRHAGVVARAAAQGDEALHRDQIARTHVEAAELGVALLQVQASAQAALDALGLLVDLLEHEVREALQIGDPVGVIVDDGDRSVHPATVEALDLDAVGADQRDLPVIQVDDAAGELDDGLGVGRDDGLAVSEADDEGGAEAGSDEEIGVIAEQHGDAVGAVHETEGGAHGGEGITLVELADQVRQDLGVGLAAELHALGLELLPQGAHVLDDAVVDHGDPARRVEVRVGVGLGDATVGGPAGVGDADAALGCLVDGALQLGDAPHALARPDLALLQEGDTRGVIAAVLQPPEALHEPIQSGLLPDVPHDSTHAFLRVLRSAAPGGRAVHAWSFSRGVGSFRKSCARPAARQCASSAAARAAPIPGVMRRLNHARDDPVAVPLPAASTVVYCASAREDGWLIRSSTRFEMPA